MNRTINYKGYIIRIENNKNDTSYPYIAIATNGDDEIIKRGHDEKQAITLTKNSIDFTITTQEINKK